MRQSAFMLVVTLWATGAIASAQTDTLQEVVKQAPQHHPALKLSATSPTETISVQELQALDLRGVDDALKLMGGVTVRDYGGLGGMKTVSIRGLAAGHTAVVLDGMPVSNSQAGQIDLSRFATYNMESIRLHIGGTDEALAPAKIGAYSGAIEMESKERNIEGAVNYGAWNTIQTSFASPWVSGLFQHTDGDYPFSLQNGQRTEHLRRDNGRVDAGQICGRFKVQGAKCKVQNSVTGYYSHRELPGSVIYYNNVGTEQLWDLNVAAQSRMDVKISDRWNMVAGLKYNYGWNKYYDASLVTTGADGTSRYRQNEWFLTTGVEYKPLPSLHISLVHDDEWGSLRTNLQGGEQPDRWITWNALRGQWHIARLTLQGEMLYTSERRKIRDGRYENHSEWTPSIAASWQPLASHPFFVRASWRKAFRLPSFNDLYYYRLGNHDLRPEMAFETNFGFTYGLEQEHGTLELTADYYYNKVHDKIVAFPTTFAWRMTNFGEARMQGMDVGVNARIDGRRVKINATAHHSYQDARDRTETEISPVSSQNSRLPYTPRWSGNAAVTAQTPWATLGWTMHWMGERYSSVMQSERYRLPSFAEHSFTLSRSIYIKGIELTLQASLLNAFDKHCQIVQYYPMPGRQWRASIVILPTAISQ